MRVGNAELAGQIYYIEGAEDADPDPAGALSKAENGLSGAAGGSGSPGANVCTGPRVGVSGPGGDATQYPWRFWLAGEATVSVYRPAPARSAKPAVGPGDP